MIADANHCRMSGTQPSCLLLSLPLFIVFLPLQAYSDFLEQELLDLFERAAGRSPPEVELMRECSDILFALNEGDHLQSRFVFFVVTQVRKRFTVHGIFSYKLFSRACMICVLSPFYSWGISFRRVQIRP